MSSGTSEQDTGVIGILALAAVLHETVLVTGATPAEDVRVACAVGRTTRIVFPEALRRLRSREEEMRPLGVQVERTRPEAVVTVTPTRHPASGRLRFQGPSLDVTLLLESAEAGDDKEVRLLRGVPETPPASPPPAAPEPPPADAGGAPPRADGPWVAPDLARARAVPIDRREGLPGQLPLVLVDALEGADWLWLRFRLEGGAEAAVERVWWERGDIADYIQERDGDDLRIVVPVPRRSVTSRTRVCLKAGRGPAYRFSLESDTLSRFFRGLFR